MTLEGIVQNGVVVFQTGSQLPDGTHVLVQPVVAAAAKPSGDSPKPTLEWLLKFAGTADDLPTDMALNHDHYLHGAPKR